MRKAYNRNRLKSSARLNPLSDSRSSIILINVTRGFQICLFFLALTIALQSCTKDDVPDKSSIPYDSKQPIKITSFMSDSGVIRTKVVIKGSNFGNDKSMVGVYFLDADKPRKATIVGLDNQTIYCLTPKQNGGANKIMVKIGRDSAIADKTFYYTVSQNISNVVGLTGTAASVDGSLADGRIQRTFGMAALGGNQVMSFEQLNGTVRYTSMNDNRIYTLQTGFGAGQPAVNAARNKVYAIQYTAPHKVIVYKQENLWAPELLSAGIYRSNGVVVAGTIMAACLDNTEQWLYFRDKTGVFGRIELANPSNVQILNETCGQTGTTDWNYMAYSTVDDCFYFGVQNIHSIFRVNKNGTGVQLWAGSNQGAVDGNRLDAKFNSPGGIAVDGEGNILIMDTNNHTVRFISHASGYVSRVAGTTGVSGFVNGDPKTSQLSFPYSIAADEENNYFLGESWGVTIRKLAIE